MENLTNRQQNILVAIVLDYVRSADPVGSRTIAKKYDLGLSPATIRNEMSELEDKGLLTQLHASSGRIPSDLGYRTFVDFLMEKPILTNQEISIIENLSLSTLDLEVVLEQTGEILSALLNTTTIIQFPESSDKFVKHFQLLPISDNSIIIIVISNTGDVSNYRVNLNSNVDQDLLYKLNNYFNEQLSGFPLNDLSSQIKKLLSNNIDFGNILKDVYLALNKNANSKLNSKVFIKGASKLLKEPEFNDNNKALSLMDFFDDLKDKAEINGLFNNLEQLKESNISVLIGEEINIEELKDCSIILGSYSGGKDINGCIGLIGPTRMRYGKSIVTMQEVTKRLSFLLSKLYGNSF